MASGLRNLLRFTVIVRPVLLLLLIGLYLSPLAANGWRTSWERGEPARAADQRRQAALRKAGLAAHAAPVYFQAALFAPLKWIGSDLCYIALSDAQTRVIRGVADRNKLSHAGSPSVHIYLS